MKGLYMQYKYIHVSCFDEVVNDMKQRLQSHYTDDKTWRSATRIANELGFKPITQRETRAISRILRQNETKKRIINGVVQFMV